MGIRKTYECDWCKNTSPEDTTNPSGTHSIPLHWGVVYSINRLTRSETVLCPDCYNVFGAAQRGMAAERSKQS